MLIVVFLFIDMFALTILYCILFFYIRIQLKNFRKVASSSEIQSSHELQSWQANLEAGTPEQPTAPKQIITTQTVTVTTEDRPQRRTMKTEADRAHQANESSRTHSTLLSYYVHLSHHASFHHSIIVIRRKRMGSHFNLYRRKYLLLFRIRQCSFVHCNSKGYYFMGLAFQTTQEHNQLQRQRSSSL